MVDCDEYLVVVTGEFKSLEALKMNLMNQLLSSTLIIFFFSFHL